MALDKKPVNIETLLQEARAYLPEPDMDVIRRAYDLAAASHDGQLRVSGEPYMQHSLAVALMLAELRLDSDTLAAALLHDTLEDTDTTLETIRKGFGEQVAKLVDGVTKLSQIDRWSEMEHRREQEHRREDEEAESLRKMFLAMVDDVRVVLIKLTDRLHNMRTLGVLPEERRKRIAKETLEIFAPLANRLGIWQIKWELEDLSSHLICQMPRRLASGAKRSSVSLAIRLRRSGQDAQGGVWSRSVNLMSTARTSSTMAGGGARLSASSSSHRCSCSRGCSISLQRSSG